MNNFTKSLFGAVMVCAAMVLHADDPSRIVREREYYSKGYVEKGVTYDGTVLTSARSISACSLKYQLILERDRLRVIAIGEFDAGVKTFSTSDVTLWSGPTFPAGFRPKCLLWDGNQVYVRGELNGDWPTVDPFTGKLGTHATKFPLVQKEAFLVEMADDNFMKLLY